LISFGTFFALIKRRDQLTTDGGRGVATNTLQDHSGESLRASLIQQLSAYSQNEDEFLNHVVTLAGTQGEKIYPVLLNIFTQLDFQEGEARSIWQGMVQHRQQMMDSMARQVNLTTAICDYMLTVRRELIHPKVVELNLFEETSHYCKCDSLTGLYNRSYFEEVLKSEASRCKRYQTEFSLVFFDLDHFKKINDTLGHPAGDMVLKSVAKLIQSEKRTEDVAVRYGGEEIILVLPGTPKNNALILAERIRRKIERMNLSYEGERIEVTVTGGIATFPLDTDIETELVECADRALYRAKNQGRNQVVLFSEDKRHNYRMDLIGPIKVQELGMKTSQQPALGRIKDLSLSGVLFESQKPLNMGSRIQVEMPLSSRDEPLVMVGRVTRSQPTGASYDVGATFLHFGEQDRADIGKHFTSLLHASSITH
jgi:diguanylate cyclase (GGDEF)-like protein